MTRQVCSKKGRHCNRWYAVSKDKILLDRAIVAVTSLPFHRGSKLCRFPCRPRALGPGAEGELTLIANC